MSTEPVTSHDALFPAPAMTQPSAPASLQSRLHKHEQFASRLIDEKHDFIVYVPQAFNDDPNRFFPVLYLHDGQNLFDPETSFIKGNYWRVGETADALIASGEVEPLVIVGIYNAGAKRIDEYTPLEDKRLGVNYRPRSCPCRGFVRSDYCCGCVLCGSSSLANAASNFASSFLRRYSCVISTTRSNPQRFSSIPAATAGVVPSVLWTRVKL